MSGLGRFVLRRLLLGTLTLFVALAAMFGLLHASPASPLDHLPPAVAADPEARAAVAAQSGLDRPILAQLGSYLAGMARGDMGASLYDGSSVARAVAVSLPVSVELGALALLLAVIPGIGLGVAAARRPGSRIDGAVRVVSVLAISVPSYWLAVAALVYLGEVRPELLPDAGGFATLTEDPVANLQALVLPAIVLGLGGFAMVARAVRTAVGAALEADDVRFARSLGMSEAGVLRRIVARRAAPATVAVLGLVAAGMVSGAVLVESVFQLPGLGQLMVLAFTRGDHPLALGTALVTAVLFLLLNLATDVATYALDPRARARTSGASA